MQWNPQIALAVFIGLVATVEDLIRREIPNWIPVVALTGGIGASAWMSGWPGLGSSLLGVVLGFAVFLVFYLLGGMGGGDGDGDGFLVDVQSDVMHCFVHGCLVS